MKTHHLISGDTLWVLVADSDENRHVFDIVFALDALRSQGINQDSVRVFTSHPDPDSLLTPFGRSVPCSELDRLASEFAQADGYEHVVVAVTGHGHMAGVGTIRPHQLVEAVRSVPNLKAGTLILCQCSAGVFDLLDVKKRPPLALLGATNLDDSLSIKVALKTPIPQSNGSPGLKTWSANIFWLYFFGWIRTPEDVDGDGRLTLLDAYKFAGSISKKHILEGKGELFLQALEAADVLRTLAPRVQGPNPTVQDRLRLKAAQDVLDRQLGFLHFSQEPWILNAEKARGLLFEPSAAGAS